MSRSGWIALACTGSLLALVPGQAEGGGITPFIPDRLRAEHCQPGTETAALTGWAGEPGRVIGCVATQSGTRVLISWRGPTAGTDASVCSSAAVEGGIHEATFCRTRARIKKGAPRPVSPSFTRLEPFTEPFASSPVLLTGWAPPGTGQARVAYTTIDGVGRSVRARMVRLSGLLASKLGLRRGRGFFAAELPPRTDFCRGVSIRLDVGSRPHELTGTNASGVAGKRPCTRRNIVQMMDRAIDPVAGLWASDADRDRPATRFLAFARWSEQSPGSRQGVAGRSAQGRPIRLLQHGVPAVDDEVLVFGCMHGDECGARHVRPIAGCPAPDADIYTVPNLNPDGHAIGTRLNGRGVDLNRNFPSAWKPIGSRGSPQFSGPRPFSEPETRLAARIIETLRPEVTIWFHQHHAMEPLVRAWGPSVPLAKDYARLAGLPFRRLPWLAGTAPNWQNHRFPGSTSFVVEFPRGEIAQRRLTSLGAAIVRLAREVGED